MEPYSTHTPFTALALMKTKELFPNLPILELGCGDYSSPMCYFLAQGRRYEIYSADPEWSSRFSDMARVNKVELAGPKQWAEVDYPRGWGLALLDSEESVVNRMKQIPALLKAAKVVVMHDAREDQIPDARFGAGFTRYRPWTWIGSDVVDVEQWLMHKDV